MLKIWDSENEGSRERWTPNSSKFNINSLNLVHMCEYKLPTNRLNVAQKSLAQVQILLVAFFFWGGGYIFWLTLYTYL